MKKTLTIDVAVSRTNPRYPWPDDWSKPRLEYFAWRPMDADDETLEALEPVSASAALASSLYKASQ